MVLKTCICSLLLLAFISVSSATAAAALQQKEPVPILSQNSDIQPDGTFEWNFESADGTEQEQNGAPKPASLIADNNKENVQQEVVQGSAKWTDPDGGNHEISYQADENGYRAQSADIPVSPEVPPQIARALEWILAHPQPEEEQEKV